MLSHTLVWKPLNKNKLPSNEENQKSSDKYNRKNPLRKPPNILSILLVGLCCLKLHKGLSSVDNVNAISKMLKGFLKLTIKTQCF